MGFRFSRRIKLLPGVHVNLGLKSMSLSVGPRGAAVTVGPRGVHGHIGLPGTGLSYRKRLDGGRARPSRTSEPVTVPDEFRIRFDGLRMLLLDTGGASLDEPVLAAVRKAFREPILDALDARAAELNAIGTLPDMSGDSPRDADEAGFALPRPVKPRDPREFDPAHPERASADAAWADYTSALGTWRAAEAEHRRNASGADAAIARVEARLAAIEWPRETLVTLDADGAVLRADVDLPEIEDLPDTQVAVARRDLALVAKPLSAIARRRAYERHICAIACRIVGETFAAAPFFAEVHVAGYTQRASGPAGATDDVYVLAVHVQRALWTAADPSDPVAALAPFRRRSAVDARGEVRRVVPLVRA